MGQILLDSVCQPCDRQRLQPDSSRAGEGGEKESIASEDHVLDARNGRDSERDTGLKKDSLGSRRNSRTGMVVPLMRFCIRIS